MTISGTNFITSGYEVIVSYMGIEQSGSASSENEITVDWSDIGLPISGEQVAPLLIFRSTETLIEMTAINTGEAGLTNEAGEPTSSALSCSFAGGCQYSVSGAGWNSSLKN
jgi:hypothetical protein